MKSRIYIAMVVGAAAALTGACQHLEDDPRVSDPLTIDIWFGRDVAGWASGVADIAEAQVNQVELESGHRTPPAGVTGDGGYYLASTNVSADLFTFITGSVQGLTPNRAYEVHFVLDFVTEAPAGCVGIGGAPGESVWLKAGAASVEPRVMRNNSYLVMNVDKGNQSEGGADAVVLGTIESRLGTCSEPEWEQRSLESGTGVQITSDETGQAWLIVGIDSGYQGRTRIFFNHLRAIFEPR